jgi:hypothetical protein
VTTAKVVDGRPSPAMTRGPLFPRAGINRVRRCNRKPVVTDRPFAQCQVAAEPVISNPLCQAEFTAAHPHGSPRVIRPPWGRGWRCPRPTDVIGRHPRSDRGESQRHRQSSYGQENMTGHGSCLYCAGNTGKQTRGHASVARLGSMQGVLAMAAGPLVVSFGLNNANRAIVEQVLHTSWR